jgi:WD40 repeat protein
VIFSPDDKRLASQSWERVQGRQMAVETRVWDAQTGQEILSVKAGGLVVDAAGGRFAIAFSPDGKRLASSGGGEL